jgi:hypothetical protein
MRVHRLCGVLECVRGKTFPIFNYRLLLEKLFMRKGREKEGRRAIRTVRGLG